MQRTKMFGKSAVVLMCSMLVLAALPARAENPQINMDTYMPSVHAWDNQDILTTRIAKPWDFNAGLWLAYRNKALNIGAGDEDSQLLQHQLVADIYGAIAIGNIFSIGLDLPVFFVSKGDKPAAVLGSLTQTEGASLGDLRLSAKIKFWKNDNKGIGVGLAQDITFPTATGDKMTGEDSLTSRTNLILDYHKSGWGLALNVGYLLRKNETAVVPTIGDELLLGLGVQIPLVCDTLELLISSSTRTLVGSPFSDSDSVGSALRGGLRIRPWKGLLITAAAGPGFGNLAGTAKWEAMLNLGWEPRPNSCDKDGDNICDKDDKCPTIKGPEATAGCPDKDMDGVLDASDRCVNVAGKPELEGCPDRDNDGFADWRDDCPDDAGIAKFIGCPDTDGDGVADKDDNCPEEAGKITLSGCPDRDNDGIEDAVDDCPDEPGKEANGGCPDRDKDGIVDGMDKCPDKWGVPKYEGCPPPTPKKVKITREKIVILDKVYFASNRAKIKKQSHAILKDVATVLKDNPWVKKLNVEGHTDDVGKDSYNLQLSQDRADAVVEFLVKEGVEANRLESTGFGETKPLVEGRSKDARAENRRVEFNIIQ